MAITPKKLDDASAQERRLFAANFLNLDLDASASDDAVLSAIRQAQPGSEMIFVEEAAPQIPENVDPAVAAKLTEMIAEDVGRQAGSLGKGDPRALIIIPELENSEGKNTDVFVGVNGRVWQLKRGVELDVPYRVIEALRNAKADVVTHSTDADSLGDVNVRTVQRVPFEGQIMPTAAEIEAWRESTGSEFCA